MTITRIKMLLIWVALGSAAMADATRIVCLGGAVTETVWALGAGDRVVAVDDSSVWPAEAADRPRVGYYRMISAEGVLSLAPDLVIASEEAGPPMAIEQLERAGVRVERVSAKASAEGCLARIQAVGEVLGVPEAAGVLASTTAEALAAVSPPTGGTPSRVLFVFARGAGTLNVSGTGTAADEMIRLAGAVNAVDAYTGYRPMTAESMLAAAPDVILLTDSGLAAIGGVEVFRSLPGVSATPAGRNNRIVALDDLYLLGFGPRLPSALADLKTLLHP